MDKYHRSRKYSRKQRPNRHRGQQLNDRYQGCSTNTIKTLRRKKSTHNRRVLKDELSKVYLRHPDLFYREELGYVPVDCECQGWDDNGNLICDSNYECQAIPNPRPASCSYKTIDKQYDYWGFFKQDPIQSRGNWTQSLKPHQYKKNKWKDSLGTKLEKSPLCKHFGFYHHLKRKNKPLRAGLRRDMSRVPYGKHPLDEPRWWAILPNNDKIKKMEFNCIDHEDYLLALGNYRVEIIDSYDPNNPIISDNSLRQMEKRWVEDRGWTYDDFGDRRRDIELYNDDLRKNKYNKLWLLRKYKIDHLSYYDRQKFKHLKPIKNKWKIHRFGRPMCPLLIAQRELRLTDFGISV